LIPRTLVLDAPPEVAARLADTEGVALAAGEADAPWASVIQFHPPPASPLQRDRLASEVRLIAVARAPVRYNAVIVGDPAATAKLARYLSLAGAVTGQVLAAAPSPPDAEATL